MTILASIAIVIQVLSAIGVIVLVLLQQGKGADMGSAFGSGSAGSLFGATGAANFMSRVTKWAAVVFFISTIGLAYVANRGNKGQDTGIMQNFTQTAPAAPAPGSAVPGVAPAAPASTSTPSVPANAVPGVPAVPGAAVPAVVPGVPAPAAK